MKIGVVCAPGIGDALILHIASHHLALRGFEVITDTPHRFGKWLSGYSFGAAECDTIFLQHDNSPKAKEIHASSKQVYTFYGSHQESKHGPLREGFDFVADPNVSMVDNMVQCLQTLFSIPATKDNGFRPPPGLVHRKNLRKVLIHTTSRDPQKNWPLPKFLKVAAWLESKGYEPTLLPHLPSLEELAATIYESGCFLGNDSGPGHIASLLDIPHLIIAREERQMRLWQPGWRQGAIALPPTWKFFQNRWKTFVTTKNVINKLKIRVLCN